MTIDAVSEAMLGVIVIGILCWWHLNRGSHGGYRKAPKASHGSSVAPADHGAGTNAASASAGAGAYGAGQLANASALANAVNYASVGAQNVGYSAAQIQSMHQSAMQAMQQHAAQQQAFLNAYAPQSPTGLQRAINAHFTPPLKIADAGIRLGEIEAWRVWRLTHGYVRSVIRDDVWAPGEPMTGKPGAGYGVFAWPTMSAALTYGIAQNVGVIVIGRVHLWGEVVEHERGYRAEYAKIIAFETIIALRSKPEEISKALATLRERYGLV